MAFVIDYNRGVTKRSHPSGVDLYMYKREPGIFLTAHGTPVDPGFARAAGFPVDKLLKEKRRMEMMAEAAVAIDYELGSAATRTVVEERDGVFLVDIGSDRYIIEDGDGQRITKTPLDQTTARKVYDQLAPPKPAEKAEEDLPKMVLNPNKDAKGKPVEPAPEKAGTKNP